jgi:hypothetical protein
MIFVSFALSPGDSFFGWKLSPDAGAAARPPPPPPPPPQPARAARSAAKAATDALNANAARSRATLSILIDSDVVLILVPPLREQACD